MRKVIAAGCLLFLGLFPLACQKTYTVGPLPAFTPTPTVTATPTAYVMEITEADFDEEVLNADGLVLVEFYASWCSHCQAFAPVLEQFARDHAGQIKVVRVDVDLDPNLTSEYGVTAYPTSVFMRNGSELFRFVGEVSGDTLDLAEGILNSALPAMAVFTAAWCSHCQEFAPIVDQFELDYAGRINVFRVDVDAHYALVSAYGVYLIPTSLFLREGLEKFRVEGYVDLTYLSNVADTFLASGP